MRWVGTCPVITTSGIESHSASVRPVTALVAPGSGGDQHGADLAGGACIAFGRVHRALLVPHENMVHFVLLKQSVVDRQHGAARITEKVLDALVGQCLDHHFRAAHFRHDSLPLSFRRHRMLELRK